MTIFVVADIAKLWQSWGVFWALFIALLVRWGYLEYSQVVRRTAARRMREVAEQLGSSVIKKDITAAQLREFLEATSEAIR